MYYGTVGTCLDVDRDGFCDFQLNDAICVDRDMDGYCDFNLDGDYSGGIDMNGDGIFDNVCVDADGDGICDYMANAVIVSDLEEVSEPSSKKKLSSLGWSLDDLGDYAGDYRKWHDFKAKIGKAIDRYW